MKRRSVYVVECRGRKWNVIGSCTWRSIALDLMARHKAVDKRHGVSLIYRVVRYDASKP